MSAVAGTTDARSHRQRIGERTMSREWKAGDRVSWNTPQGMTTGRVVRAISSRTHQDGHTVAGSKDDLRYEVESENSGKRAVHRAQALHKTGAG
jgi:hypothetical protein